MKREKALELVSNYIEGWKTNDVERILQTVADNCTVIESHGATFTGMVHIRRWVENWMKEGHTVDRWNLLSFLQEGNLASFEWDFKCTVNGEAFEITGASIVKFGDDKICSLKEYKLTHKPYDCVV